MKDGKKLTLTPRKVATLGSLGFAQDVIFLLPYISYVFYKPLQDTLNCTNAQVGLLLSVYGVVAMLSFFPGGWLADRFNPKKLVMASLVFVGILVCICAFFPNYYLYVAIWILVGIGANLIYWSAGMKSVRLTAEPNEQGKAYGYFYFFNNGTYYIIAAIATAILAAFAGNESLGFRYIVFFYGVLNFVAALLVWKIVPSTNKKEVTSQTQSDEDKITIKSILTVLKRKETWLFSVMAFSCYTMYALPAYFTPYFTDVLKLSVTSAAIIYVLTGPLGALLSPLMGTICDFIGSTVKTIIFVLVIVLGVITATAIFSGSFTLTIAIVVNVVLTTVTVGSYTIMFSSIEETGMDRKLAGTCIGVGSIIAYLPDIFMFTLFGTWLDNHGNDGYKMIFTYGAIITAIGLAAASILYVTIKKRRQARTSA